MEAGYQTSTMLAVYCLFEENVTSALEFKISIGEVYRRIGNHVL